jgi:sodium-dependent phosphate cotransporter
LKILAKIAVIAGALFLFVFSLETIKESAAGLGPLLASMRVSGAGNLFGLGWLMAYAVLSGSPVAAVALGLFSAGTIDQIETLGMIAGSRFGAAFVVLLSGTLHYLRGRRQIITVATGVLSLLVTWTIYAPATLGAYALLRSGLFAGMRLEAAAPLGSFLDGTFSRPRSSSWRGSPSWWGPSASSTRRFRM